VWKPGSTVASRGHFHYGRPVFGYTLALTTAAIAGTARVALMADGDFRGPFILFYPAIALASFLGGVGPGLLTIVASGLFAYAGFPHFPTPISWIVLAILGPLVAAGFAHFREVSEKSRSAAGESARFRYISDHVSDWIFLTGESGLIQFANATACRELGIAMEQLTGRAIEGLVPEWQRAGLRDLREQCIAGKALRWEIAFERRDGSVAYADVGCTAVRANGEMVVHFAARDITERKQLDAKLRHARQWESMRVLAGGVAHDFNNLLTSIMGNAALARQALQGEAAAGLLADIERSGDRAAELVRMMLATAGYRPSYNTWLRMDRLLQGILEGHEIPEHVTLNTNVPAFLFSGDRQSLETLLWNLIANAVESYGESPGEVGVSIWSGAASARAPGNFEEGEVGQRECLAIAVEDHGCGMAAEILDKAFDPFFTTKFTGRGLGLPAVRGIVRAYSGLLWVKTSPGEGTRVEVWLPEPPAM
jgi:PAS domain S-box-containing protein